MPRDRSRTPSRSPSKRRKHPSSKSSRRDRDDSRDSRDRREKSERSRHSEKISSRSADKSRDDKHSRRSRSRSPRRERHRTSERERESTRSRHRRSSRESSREASRKDRHEKYERSERGDKYADKSERSNRRHSDHRGEDSSRVSGTPKVHSESNLSSSSNSQMRADQRELYFAEEFDDPPPETVGLSTTTKSLLEAQEERIRQRRERVEKWRKEKEEARLRELENSATEPQNENVTSKVWSLEDDEDDDEAAAAPEGETVEAKPVISAEVESEKPEEVECPRPRFKSPQLKKISLNPKKIPWMLTCKT
ncbi:hypothetical protein DSO57_1019758 [Entomophthora muscae]|uniref:Uncharacterized protein n=1 Tax=Entomophthora muscae TaxID=34485 RepID=A0ACC2SSR7_9FUNG|nr:hypothetical protein DSO57_1019758 [Entomophthora muscae]